MTVRLRLCAVNSCEAVMEMHWSECVFCDPYFVYKILWHYMCFDVAKDADDCENVISAHAVNDILFTRVFFT